MTVTADKRTHDVDISHAATGATCCRDGLSPVFAREERLGSTQQHNPLMHWHDGIEIVRVEQGSMVCHVNESAHTLQAGDVCLINGRRMHRALDVDNSHCRYSVMIIDPAQLTRDDAVYERFIAPVLEDESLDYLLGTDCTGSAGEVCQLMNQIMDLHATRPPAYELEVIALVHLVFKQVYLRQQALAAEHVLHAASSDAATLRAMTSFIYSHFAERITLEDIASAGGVSRSKCSNMFRDLLDTSPVEFLNQYRLEAAARLLESTDDTISRISLACGFTQQSYFNRVFMRKYGCTPKQYRADSRASLEQAS